MAAADKAKMCPRAFGGVREGHQWRWRSPVSGVEVFREVSDAQPGCQALRGSLLCCCCLCFISHSLLLAEQEPGFSQGWWSTLLLQAPSYGRVLLNLSQLRGQIFLLSKTVWRTPSGKLLPRFGFASCHPWDGVCPAGCHFCWFIPLLLFYPSPALWEMWGSLIDERSLKALNTCDGLWLLAWMSIFTSSFYVPKLMPLCSLLRQYFKLCIKMKRWLSYLMCSKIM